MCVAYEAPELPQQRKRYQDNRRSSTGWMGV
jgi:hypothetical protein